MAALALALAGPAGAQQQDVRPVAAEGAVPAAVPLAETAILTVDQEALWRGSAWGQRAQAALEAAGVAIAAENDRIAAALEAEDAALTELRKTLPPEEFRARADAFDERVQQVRRDRDAAATALRTRIGEERSAFLNASLPVFSEVMAERGAVVVFDRADVFLSADAIDITDDLVARVNAQVGPGPTSNAPVRAQPVPVRPAPTPPEADLPPDPDAPAESGNPATAP